jgi:hypothetical protein
MARSREQTGALSRRKGATFERKIVKLIEEAFPGSRCGRANQSHLAYLSDVHVKEGPILLKSFWFECTDSANPDPAKKMRQAANDCRADDPNLHRVPVVVWHKKGRRVINVTMRLNDYMRLHGGEYNRTTVLVTTSWDEWVAWAKEMSE